MALDTSQNRSTANAPQNSTYPDLSMTQYPAKIDSRVSTDPGYNPNMKGFVNVQDATATTPLDKMWNMAEHVNALADAVMAIQKVLGIMPQLDVNGQANTKGTVDGRIELLEDPDRYDSRYGGTNWITTQTLVGHTHTGVTGHPSKIDLSKEVQALLAKTNIDLTTSTGLTGADISMSSQVSTKISDAVADKLSTTQGGTISADLSITGKLNTSIQREWDNTDVSDGSKLGSVYSTNSGVAYRGSGTAEVKFISDSLTGLEYGKYVVGARLRTSSLATEQVAYINVTNMVGGKSVTVSQPINGTDFDSVNTFKMFYLVCTVEGDASSSISSITIAKDATNASINVDFDHAFIMPVHPAIFDK